MDKQVKKSKKKRPPKSDEKEKLPLFPHDLKSIKDNFKKEFLRTVKINNSFRLKGPRATKVILNNMDDSDVVYETPDLRYNPQSPESECDVVAPIAVEPNIVDLPVEHGSSDISVSDVQSSDNLENECHKNTQEVTKEAHNIKENPPEVISEFPGNETKYSENFENGNLRSSIEDVLQLEHNDNNVSQEVIDKDYPTALPNIGASYTNRNRKYSLDNTLLSRRQSWSQSEIDLHSVGKSPLERKSSFFRKKLDRFFKNTSEIFRRQSSVNIKSENLQRRGSISLSLQSLNNPKIYETDGAPEVSTIEAESLENSSAKTYSESSLVESQSSQPSRLNSQASLVSSQTSLADSPHLSQPKLYASQPLVDGQSEGYSQDSMLSSRAISVSSGLDNVEGANRRKAKRANRVTWLASDSVAEYMRRIVQDNRHEDIPSSYADIPNVSASPSNSSTLTRAEWKGRRLSYQRAVSGEDPVRYHESSFRRRSKLSELNEARYELVNLLAEFTRVGIPPMNPPFPIAPIPATSMWLLLWVNEDPQRLEHIYDAKNLTNNDESRQAVIRELVATEADYIKHVRAIVDVFMAVAHALQDNGLMLDIDTERLFLNIPDVLNASLYFWDATIVPMLKDALDKESTFNTDYMYMGFYRFRDLFLPYERYVTCQTKALDYLRSLSGNADFMAYLTWCHGQKACNRLQLSDILVKPMQRLTKYSLILRRIVTHTDTEPERTSLIAMELFAKNYVLDLNRSIRQKDEIEKLDSVIQAVDVFEIDFKDDEMDRLFRCYSNLNLRAPMAGCVQNHSRTLVYQGDVRFKDNLKETKIEVRAFLLTDMLLICKKLSPKSAYQFKLIRAKYMLEKMRHFPQFKSQSGKPSKDMSSIVVVMLDEVGSSCHSFALYETKDGNQSLKIWEQKIREAKLSYDLSVWFARNPSRDLSELDMDSSSELGTKQSSDDMSIEREARERVAAMIHRSMGVSTDYDFSLASMNTDSFDVGEASGASERVRTSGAHSMRHPMQRTSTGGSSRNSRLSSFQQSTSAASHDEPQPGPSKGASIYRWESSVEHIIPPQNPEDDITSITVNVVSESESETIVPQPPIRVPSRGQSITQKHTLRVQPQCGAMALVHSLPDLTIDPSPRPTEGPQSTSEKVYQTHQEVLNKNRLLARPHSAHLLSPDNRGTSYPPPSPSPTRAYLKRGLAFSYSFRNPPLTKMRHVNSQTQIHVDWPSTSIIKCEGGVINPVVAAAAVAAATSASVASAAAAETTASVASAAIAAANALMASTSASTDNAVNSISAAPDNVVASASAASDNAVASISAADNAVTSTSDASDNAVTSTSAASDNAVASTSSASDNAVASTSTASVNSVASTSAAADNAAASTTTAADASAVSTSTTADASAVLTSTASTSTISSAATEKKAAFKQLFSTRKQKDKRPDENPKDGE